MTTKFLYMDIKVDEKTVVVFDLDDTLYNEIDFLRSAYREIARKIDSNSWKVLFSKMFSLYRCSLDVFDWLSSNYNVEKPELIRIYRMHQPEIYLFEGVLELFVKIKDKKGKIGIITDGRTSTQTGKIEALGIQKFVDLTVISEEVGTEKPDEHNYRTVENTFQNHGYLYIADNFRKDFIAANKLGWLTIGLIDNGLNIHYDSHKYMSPRFLPHHLVNNFGEINVI